MISLMMKTTAKLITVVVATTILTTVVVVTTILRIRIMDVTDVTDVIAVIAVIAATAVIVTGVDNPSLNKERVNFTLSLLLYHRLLSIYQVFR